MLSVLVVLLEKLHLRVHKHQSRVVLNSREVFAVRVPHRVVHLEVLMLAQIRNLAHGGSSEGPKEDLVVARTNVKIQRIRGPLDPVDFFSLANQRIQVHFVQVPDPDVLRAVLIDSGYKLGVEADRDLRHPHSREIRFPLDHAGNVFRNEFKFEWLTHGLIKRAILSCL